MEEETKKTESVEKEGAKVTGGTDAAEKGGGNNEQEKSSEAHAPEEAATKEKMTGYNELPEQSKVGGG